MDNKKDKGLKWSKKGYERLRSTKRKQRKNKKRGLHIRKKHGPRHHMRTQF